jgi:tRNA nucleotidyltransferase (CCA-adding enzyme)
MQSTRESRTLQTVETVASQLQAWSSLVNAIVRALDAAGGTVLAVGGAVRDCFLGKPLKDLDCEVYNLSLESLEDILKQFGLVRTVGKAFGVLRIDGLDTDWSLPRSDAEGRRPRVALDKAMTYHAACKRRDLTINAIGINLKTGELIDPCDGLSDLCAGILRSPDITQFSADPLRLYRVMQFVSRFQMRVDDALNTVCSAMDVSAVSRERIEQEWHKMMLRSERPSLGIRWLASINRLHDLFPELHALINVPQRADYHPEGNVFEHTMQALDAAVSQLHLCKTELEKRQLFYATLCHDIGKPSTTVWDQNRWRSPGHAEAGVPIARSLLRRITREKDLIKAVLTLVEYHMEPGSFVRNNASDGAYKKLALKLHPTTCIRMLTALSFADRAGRNAMSGVAPLGAKTDGSGLPLVEEDGMITQFAARAQQLDIWEQPEPPVLSGDDLKGFCPPGPQLGVLLRRAYVYQITHGDRDKNQLLRYIRRLST